jgi:hypothetical protein
MGSMLLKGIIAVLAFSLAGFSGCMKSAAPVATTTNSAPAAATSTSKTKDLGVLQLTNNAESCVAFGPGRDCRITPKILDRNNVQLTLTVESKNAAGKTAGLSVVRLTGKSQQQFDISIGDTDFTFTPDIASAK